MIRMSLSRAAAVTGGVVHGANVEWCGVGIDSRTLRPGMLFVALPGSRVDGHDYVAAAAQAGAAAALVSRRQAVDLPQLFVADVERAFGRLAAAWRAGMQAIVIAITGSNGKTTVKNLLAAVLALKAPVLATAGNLNNELGVPLTLAGLGAEHRYAVLEMGARKPGDLTYLASLAKPALAAVNNVGPAHLETFGSLDGVARGKGEIYAALPPDGIAVINADEPYAAGWAALAAPRRIVRFGRGATAEVRLVDDDAAVVTPAGRFRLALLLSGAHNRMNALAAAALAYALEVPVETIAAGLATVEPAPGRLFRTATARGFTVIDDSYNANPASLAAALAAGAGGGPLWLVLGELAELGTHSPRLHAEMGRAARAAGVARLFACGPLCRHTVEAFGTGGVHFANRETLIAALVPQLEAGIVCLVKGSRSAGMEHVAQALIAAGGV